MHVVIILLLLLVLLFCWQFLLFVCVVLWYALRSVLGVLLFCFCSCWESGGLTGICPQARARGYPWKVTKRRVFGSWFFCLCWCFVVLVAVLGVFCGVGW